MASTAYYSLNTSPLVYVQLPVSPRHGGSMKPGTVETNIEHTTIRGVTAGLYRLSNRDVWTMVFRMTETQLAAFQTMHNAVDGRKTPFYFKLGSAVLFCRKEAGFAPVMQTTPRVIPIWEYTLTLTAEITAASIGA